jgi:hypothetical protein
MGGTAVARLVFAAFFGAVYTPCAHSRALSAPPKACAYRQIFARPMIEFSTSDVVAISPEKSFYLIWNGEEGAGDVIFTKDGRRKRIAAKSDRPFLILSEREIGITDHGSVIALNLRTGEKRRAEPNARDLGVPLTDKGEALPNGDRLLISHIYSTNLLARIVPGDAKRYNELKHDLQNGTYCGARLEALQPRLKANIAKLTEYIIFDDLSSGNLDRYDQWTPYKRMIELFLDRRSFDRALEIYGFRAVDAARSDPLLSKVDPDKVFGFAWAGVSGLFEHEKRLVDDGGFVRFTDISVFQRNGKMTFTLLGTETLSGGEQNGFGFYQKFLAEIDISTIVQQKSFNWSWRQGSDIYSASITVTPQENKYDIKQSAFPKYMKHGLILLDKTLTPEESVRTVETYKSYFRQAGFFFKQRRQLHDMRFFLTRQFTQNLDYMVREGHADGDDDHLMALYKSGFVIEGEKKGQGGAESVAIVFNTVRKTKEDRVGYDEFARLLNRLVATTKRPLVYVNTSCWGIEKAWFSLGNFYASQLIEVAARSPVDLFSVSQLDVTRLLLDAVRSGADFEGLRLTLKSLDGYASGRSDIYVLPDEAEYPQAQPIAKVRRSLFVREADGRLRRYTPNGYF